MFLVVHPGSWEFLHSVLFLLVCSSVPSAERELIDHTPSRCLECLRRDRLLQESYSYAPPFMGLGAGKNRQSLHRSQNSIGNRFRRRNKPEEELSASLSGEEKGGGKKGFLKGWKSRLGRLSVLQPNPPEGGEVSSLLTTSEPEASRPSSPVHAGSVVRLGCRKTIGLLLRTLEESSGKPRIFRAAAERILEMLFSEALEQFQLVPTSSSVPSPSSAQSEMAIFPPTVVLNWRTWAREAVEKAVLPFSETLSIRAVLTPVPNEEEANSDGKSGSEDDFDSDGGSDDHPSFQGHMEELFADLGDPKQHLFLIATLQLDPALVSHPSFLPRPCCSLVFMSFLCLG